MKNKWTRLAHSFASFQIPDTMFQMSSRGNRSDKLRGILGQPRRENIEPGSNYVSEYTKLRKKKFGGGVSSKGPTIDPSVVIDAPEGEVFAS